MASIARIRRVSRYVFGKNINQSTRLILYSKTNGKDICGSLRFFRASLVFFHMLALRESCIFAGEGRFYPWLTFAGGRGFSVIEAFCCRRAAFKYLHNPCSWQLRKYKNKGI